MGGEEDKFSDGFKYCNHYGWEVIMVMNGCNGRISSVG